MAALRQIVDYCNDLLRIQEFRDYCPNGLQVEGKSEVNKIIAGVTASQDFIEQAVEQGADAVLVHHGYLWKNESSSITGLKKNRIASLLNNQVSLLAYHLPLDAHPHYGNNAELGRLLGIESVEYVDQGELKGLLAGTGDDETLLKMAEKLWGRESFAYLTVSFFRKKL